MNKIILKNWHYSINQFNFMPIFYIFNKYKIDKNIKFTKDSYFEFEGEDKFDYSKLFGLSFGHHQKNESYRFGFRMINDTEINISLYYYIKGKRFVDDILNLNYNIEYKFRIEYHKKDKTINYIIIDDKNNIIFIKDFKIQNFKCIGYNMNLYIGGNNPAPKKLKFNII